MTMKIAVDAMGGDNAPRAIVNGAVSAARMAKPTRISHSETTRLTSQEHHPVPRERHSQATQI